MGLVDRFPRGSSIQGTFRNIRGSDRTGADAWTSSGTYRQQPRIPRLSARRGLLWTTTEVRDPSRFKL